MSEFTPAQLRELQALMTQRNKSLRHEVSDHLDNALPAKKLETGGTGSVMVGGAQGGFWLPAAAGNGYGITSDTSQAGGVKWEKAAYIAPTLAGTWANFGAPQSVAGYTKTPTGIVTLKGGLKRTGTSGLNICTLPAGYRPLATMSFLVTATMGAGVVRVDVTSAGTVDVIVGDPGVAIVFLSIAGISFLAEA